MKKLTCFVISPIGEEGSEIREHANEVFRKIIKHELQHFKIEPWRSDLQSKGNNIVKEMVENIKNADICIVDLTGYNPNVMFEFGIRHQTGKPYILIKDKDPKWDKRENKNDPFDTYTERRKDYDLNDVDSIQECQIYIKDKIEENFGDGTGKAGKSSEKNPAVTESAAAAIIGNLSEAIRESTETNIENTELIFKKISDKMDEMLQKMDDFSVGTKNSLSEDDKASFAKIFIEEEIIKKSTLLKSISAIDSFVTYCIREDYNADIFEYIIDSLDRVLEDIEEKYYPEASKTVNVIKARAAFRIATKFNDFEYFKVAFDNIENAITNSVDNESYHYDRLVILHSMRMHKKSAFNIDNWVVLAKNSLSVIGYEYKGRVNDLFSIDKIMNHIDKSCKEYFNKNRSDKDKCDLLL